MCDGDIPVGKRMEPYCIQYGIILKVYLVRVIKICGANVLYDGSSLYAYKMCNCICSS